MDCHLDLWRVWVPRPLLCVLPTSTSWCYVFLSSSPLWCGVNLLSKNWDWWSADMRVANIKTARGPPLCCTMGWWWCWKCVCLSARAHVFSFAPVPATLRHFPHFAFFALSVCSPPPALPPKKRQSAPSPTRVAVVAPMSRGSSLPCSVHRQVKDQHT